MDDPRKVSAQFAAYAWYADRDAEPPPGEARAFAREHWAAFLPCAHEGLGRLILRIAAGRGKVRRAATARMAAAV